MGKLNWTAVLAACVFMISVMAGMVVVIKPDTVKASGYLVDFEEENQENKIEEPKPHGTISVTGSAIIECEPDILVIFLRITYLHPVSAAKAAEEVAKILDNLLSSLQKLGVSKDDVATTSYNIEKRYEWEYENGYKEKRVFKGYEVINKIKVSIKDFDKGGKVIDAAVNAGVLVDSIKFELSRVKRDELKHQAIEMAAKDAKLKAETITVALGEKLGHVKSVNLGNYVYRPYMYWEKGRFADETGESVPPTTILPGDLTVSATVNVVFDIL